MESLVVVQPVSRRSLIKQNRTNKQRTFSHSTTKLETENPAGQRSETEHLERLVFFNHSWSGFSAIMPVWWLSNPFLQDEL